MLTLRLGLRATLRKALCDARSMGKIYMPNTKFCQGISDISDSYTGFIIDTWGVIHDGEKVFESAIECLKELKARKTFVLLMSNSEFRTEQMVKYLRDKGMPDGLYSEILTSGELLWQGIKNQNEGIFQGLGQSYYLIGGERTRNFLSTLPVTEEKDVSSAKIFLISGWDPLEGDLSVYDEAMKEAIRCRLKAICINPDTKALIGTNFAGGVAKLARRYEELGGVIQMIGKPYKPIFHHCIKVLHQNDIYPGQTVMVGDSMAHDILGASLVNMDTCLVKNGMHSGVFKNAATPADVNKILNILVTQFNNIRPTYMVDRLKWGKALPDRKHRRRSA